MPDRWMVSPECLRPGKRTSTRWLWFVYDERWQHTASGVKDTHEEAMEAVRRA